MHVLAIICVAVPILFAVFLLFNFLCDDLLEVSLLAGVIVACVLFIWGVYYLGNEKSPPPQAEKASP